MSPRADSGHPANSRPLTGLAPRVGMSPLTDRFRRRLVAEFRNLRLLWRELRWSILFTLAVWALAAVALHHGYPRHEGEEPMVWGRSIFYTLVLTFFGPELEYREAMPWWVKAVFYALPLLGLFVIVDTIVRLNSFLFKRRHNRREWQEMLASTYRNHVVVCGVGHVGFRIVEQLVEMGKDCVAIEQAENEFTAEAEGLGVPILYGPAHRQDTLARARVDAASAIVAATDNDLVNLDVGLTAREANPTIRVILRLFDQRLAKKIERISDIDAAFSTSALSAALFAAAAVGRRDLISSFTIENEVFHTTEIVVEPGSRLEGRTLDSLRSQFEVTFLMHQDAGAEINWNPEPFTVLRSGAKVVVVANVKALHRLEVLGGRVADPR